jgi:preprotein translocase subunit SecY
MPANFIFEAGTRINGAGGPIALITEILLLFVVILGTIMLVQGTRRVPVQYARRIVGNKQYGGVRVVYWDLTGSMTIRAFNRRTVSTLPVHISFTIRTLGEYSRRIDPAKSAAE